MHGYLIDPFEKKITQVEVLTKDRDADIQSIYKHLQCGCFTIVRVHDNGDVIFVDDEGLLKPNKFFRVSSYPQPLAGYGLWMGTTGPFTVNPRTPLNEVQTMIEAANVHFTGLRRSTEENVEILPGVTGTRFTTEAQFKEI